MNGTPLVEVLSTLRAEGFPEDEAVRFCASLYDDDAAFEAGQWIAQQLHKIHSVLAMREQMRDLSDDTRGRRAALRVERAGVPQ